ncbi:MAG TPA: M48 family metallopeptidase [Longimicrobiaceae bacterium]|nr:M48 family metallopeptidase [Longimicrobiaceae bacterium]
MHPRDPVRTAAAPAAPLRTPLHAARRGAAFVLLAALLALASGCVNEEQERVLGGSIAEEIGQTVPLVRDPVLNLYVGRLGQRLGRVSSRPTLPYHFYIIDSEQVNAFALPGGYVYLTRGLIERTENISELAAVLAHEIGHVAARHGAHQLERQLRTGSMVDYLYWLILGRTPALLENQAIDLAGELWMAKNSRAAEAEADRLAVAYLVKAGFDPAGLVTLLERLSAEDGDDPHRAADEWFSTHPITQARITAAEREIRSLPESGPRTLVRDVASYPAFLRRLDAAPMFSLPDH